MERGPQRRAAISWMGRAFATEPASHREAKAHHLDRFRRFTVIFLLGAFLLAGRSVLCAPPEPQSSPPEREAGARSGSEGVEPGDRNRGQTLADLKRGRGQPASAAGEIAAAPPSRVLEYFKVLGLLVGVIAVAVATIFILKRFVPGASRARTHRDMEILSKVALTAKHQLLMVRIAERVLVLGISPQGITRVTEMNEPHEVMQATRSASFQKRLSDEEAVFDSPESEGEEKESQVIGTFGREVDRLKSMIASWRMASATRTGSTR